MDGFVPTVERGLFGGAMSCSVPSAGWIDVSDIREVPDNQEVFMEVNPAAAAGHGGATSASGSCGTDAVTTNPAQIVIEIVEYQRSVSDDNSASFFWDNLCEDNNLDPKDQNSSIYLGAPDLPRPPANPPSKPKTSPSLWTTFCRCPGTGSNPNRPTIRCCAGYQKIAIGRDTDAGGNCRTGQQEIIWVVVNLAVIRLPQQQSEILISLSNPISLSPTTKGNKQHPLTSNQALDDIIHPVWLGAVTTIKVHDWSLFG